MRQVRYADACLHMYFITLEYIQKCIASYAYELHSRKQKIHKGKHENGQCG
jgi:hypothetical protein